MATVTKFTFDLDFDAPQAVNEPETVIEEEETEEFEEETPTFNEEEVAAARAEGFDEGKEAGRKEAADATEQKLLESMDRVAHELANVYNTQAAANADMAREMLAVATGIAKKMFPDLNARNALGEVERVVQETLKAITDEPRVQIMVHPDLREIFSERLATLTNRAGFEGKVFVNPDPSIELGDCRIEWSHGAAERNSEELWAAIDEIVDRNLHGAPMPTPEPEQSEQDSAASAPENITDGAPDQTTNEQPESETQDVPVDQEAEPESESTPQSDVDMTETEAETTVDEVDVATSETDESASEELEEPPFMPHVDLSEGQGEPIEGVDSDEQIPDVGEAPVPHIDDMNNAGDNSEADEDDDKRPATMLNTGDPVSPEMTAAILDAQADMPMDDEDET